PAPTASPSHASNPLHASRIKKESIIRLLRCSFCRRSGYRASGLAARWQNDFLARRGNGMPDTDRFDFSFALVGRRHRLRANTFLDGLTWREAIFARSQPLGRHSLLLLRGRGAVAHHSSRRNTTAP